MRHPAMIPAESHSLPLRQAALTPVGWSTYVQFSGGVAPLGATFPRGSPFLYPGCLPCSNRPSGCYLSRAGPAAPSGHALGAPALGAVSLLPRTWLSPQRAVWYPCLPLRHSSLSIFQAESPSFLMPNTYPRLAHRRCSKYRSLTIQFFRRGRHTLSNQDCEARGASWACNTSPTSKKAGNPVGRDSRWATLPCSATQTGSLALDIH